MTMFHRQVHRFFRRIGVHIQRYRDPIRDAANLLGAHRVCTAIDGGAYHGGITHRLLHEFPHANIHAFEPQADTYRLIHRRFAGHPRVRLYPAALSTNSGEARLFVTTQGFTTSLLKATDTDIAPLACEQNTTTVSLDDWQIDAGSATPEFIKLDLQGHELDALRGAELMLRTGTLALLIEVNFCQRYEGCCLFHEVASHLAERDFRLYRFYEVLCGRNGALRQADALFLKDDVFESCMAGGAPGEST